jgi:uncharacterized protein YbjT (DUF2867 family)
MTRILVTGGSSVVGDYLLPRLATAGHTVTVLSRRPRAEAGWRQVDAAREPVWDAASVGTEMLINLAPLPLLSQVLPHARGRYRHHQRIHQG